ncbi:hypothetical protein [uncultured Hydrogenophaga sp.]|uniref:hypothetical protein n=1 Tax=uncultured Hydrogenophaga sp. TaxID=199683 RepID=UPI00265F31D5|nr:hypothetical protein [uncultured Hydrogenophaga sp.]
MASIAPTLTRVPASEAAQAFAKLADMDPTGQQTPQGAARAGECFRIEGTRGLARCAVSFRDSTAWIHAAVGEGEGMTADALSIIEAQALVQGCRRVGFQTIRRGLVRRALRLGYRITSNVGTGFVLVKQIP